MICVKVSLSYGYKISKWYHEPLLSVLCCLWVWFEICNIQFCKEQTRILPLCVSPTCGSVWMSRRKNPSSNSSFYKHPGLSNLMLIVKFDEVTKIGDNTWLVGHWWPNSSHRPAERWGLELLNRNLHGFLSTYRIVECPMIDHVRWPITHFVRHPHNHVDDVMRCFCSIFNHWSLVARAATCGLFLLKSNDVQTRNLWEGHFLCALTYIPSKALA